MIQENHQELNWRRDGDSNPGTSYPVTTFPNDMRSTFAIIFYRTIPSAHIRTGLCGIRLGFSVTNNSAGCVEKMCRLGVCESIV